jgi:mRNA interferase HigB
MVIRMRVIARKTLRDFWEKPSYADSEQPLKAWFHEACKAEWTSPADVKEKYRSASVLKNNRIVFNIAGNKYRLSVSVNYPYRVVTIRFVGAHKMYDAIDAATV